MLGTVGEAVPLGCSQALLVQILALQLAHLVAFGRLLTLSEIQLPRLYKGKADRTCHVALFRTGSKADCVKHLIQCHSEYFGSWLQ